MLNLLIGLISAVSLVFCLYFTLTFFQHVQSGDERVSNLAKLYAVLCLAISVVLPIVCALAIYINGMKG